jgi:hypothetical protein
METLSRHFSALRHQGLQNCHPGPRTRLEISCMAQAVNPSHCSLKAKISQQAVAKV